MTRKQSGTTVSRASAWKKRLKFLFVGDVGRHRLRGDSLPWRRAGKGRRHPARTARTQNYPVRQATATTPVKSAAAAPTSTSASTRRPRRRSAGVPSGTAQKAGGGKASKKLVSHDRGGSQRPQDHPRGTRPKLPSALRRRSDGDDAQQVFDRRRLPAGKHHRHPGGGRCRNRTAGVAVQPAGRSMAENVEAGDAASAAINTPTKSSGRPWRCGSWPATKTKVTREEIVEEYEIMYGKQVRARLIALDDPKKAEEIREDAAAHAADAEYFGTFGHEAFGRCAERGGERRHSADPPARHVSGNREGGLRHERSAKFRR